MSCFIFGERSSLTYEKIDTSTRVLGYMAGTVESVQSTWNVPSFQSDNSTDSKNRKEVLQSIKNKVNSHILDVY